MTDNIVVLDFETTGLDVQKDFIIQIGLIKADSETLEEFDNLKIFIKPDCEYTISPEAEEKHGISKEFLEKNGECFIDVWPKIVEFIGDCDILTYNGNGFDLKVLYYNLQHYGFTFDFTSRIFYDALTIERKRWSMKLIDVYKRYTGVDYDDAHDALADVRATLEVFKHQRELVEDIFDDSFNIISPEGFVRHKDGILVFATGKYANQSTNEICISDPSYIRWVFNTFSLETKTIIRDEYYKAHPKE